MIGTLGQRIPVRINKSLNTKFLFSLIRTAYKNVQRCHQVDDVTPVEEDLLPM